MDLLADFEVIKALGQGGFGSVLLVKDKRANKEYAIKLIPSRCQETDVVVREVETLAKMAGIEGTVKYHHSWYQQFDTPTSFEDFRKELEAKTSDSIHLSECLSSGSSNDGLQVGISTILFIKMDYFQGVNLKEWLRSLCKTANQQPNGSMTKPWVHGQVLLAFYKILETVLRIHHAGILHRDLKPENILFKDPCEICICDFGLSKCVTGNHSFEGSDQAQHTHDIGTRTYLAPELLLSPPSPHSEQSDAYALGLVFLEMLTIFGCVTESEALQKKNEIFKCHKNGEIHENAKQFENETDLIQKLLHKDPSQRCSVETALNDNLFNKVPFVCNICGITEEKGILGIECFKQHLEGKNHKKTLKNGCKVQLRQTRRQLRRRSPKPKVQLRQTRRQLRRRSPKPKVQLRQTRRQLRRRSPKPKVQLRQT
ncbi:hypothetical protein BOX15_Mlig025762g1 [Macrostomum lignano]|uniref:non-specific serine/threonine protein kinase n=1 Tax=Macrostomum lignano TaxID=282301 RepID=A0A267H355_9PLAT|nr:hypothetical protein BOX15_Mlig025762g1 [Macrostomum lignano]